MEDITKLPKWAQQQIAVLEANLKSSNEKIESIFFDGDSNVLIQNGLSYSKLPPNSHIKFNINGGSVTVYPRSDGSLDINTSSLHKKITTILPRASNSVYIKFLADD